MNEDDRLEAGLQRILARDHRYKRGAYAFVAEAVTLTAAGVAEEEGGRRHVSGRELLEGIRRAALEQYGPLALNVLRDWGVTRTEDFGNVVFNMVRNGLLGASDEDTPEEFANGYNFDEAFLKPFAEPGNSPSDLPKIA